MFDYNSSFDESLGYDPEEVEEIKWSDYCQFTPRQIEARNALLSGKRFLLYGGALGGGKSYFLRWMLLERLMELYVKFDLRNVTVMLACEDYPSLKDRQLQKIELEFPSWVGSLRHDHKTYGRSFVLDPLYGGGAICFRNLDDPSKYQSAEFAAIAVDELTKNTYDTFTHLRSRLRWPGLPDLETWFIAGTNPGGIGHAWVRQLWIDRLFPEEWLEPIDFSPNFAFIPSKADDNPHLDSAYWSTLQTLPPNLRAAFRDGSWDVFVGQAFPEFSREAHGYKWDGKVPQGSPVYMTLDWGYGKPFSVIWWYTDGDGRLYAFNEWYGWNGVPDSGLRMVDSDIAKGIKEREAKLGIDKMPVIRLAGHDSWNKKPDYKGGGQGPSTAEEFAKAGLYLVKADPSRELKLRQFRERIRIREGERPMLMVSDRCTHLLRTLPTLMMDQNNIEDIDTTGEDHAFDSACQVVMARPLPLKEQVKPKTLTEKLVDSLNRPDISQEREFYGDYDMEETIDGNLIDTL